MNIFVRVFLVNVRLHLVENGDWISQIIENFNVTVRWFFINQINKKKSVRGFNCSRVRAPHGCKVSDRVRSGFSIACWATQNSWNSWNAPFFFGMFIQYWWQHCKCFRKTQIADVTSALTTKNCRWIFFQSMDDLVVLPPHHITIPLVTSNPSTLFERCNSSTSLNGNSRKIPIWLTVLYYQQVGVIQQV